MWGTKHEKLLQPKSSRGGSLTNPGARSKKMDNQNQKPNPGSQENSKNKIHSLTQENATESNAVKIPGISLPKGGGALKGIDEKFEVNAANGTAAFNIPLPVTPGRNGFSPALTLNYNSGGGNSPYGLGWSINFPSIQRKTDKQLPRYRDRMEEDIFMFSGSEDLVPFLTEAAPGNWQTLEYCDPIDDNIKIKRYRPRIENNFARIEKISHPTHGVYWKVTTRENTVTIFGRDHNARIADPDDNTRVFQWLPEFGYDDKGNWIKYRYKAENPDNVPDVSYENNRLNGISRFANKYLKRVQYGNRVPYYADPLTPYDPQTPPHAKHFFQAVFDYGEHDALSPTPDAVPGQLWDYRADAFSNYRAGFEIRTNRLCKRVLMFHQFPELGNEPCLVRSLDFKYAPSSINQSGQAETTYLESVTQTGYICKLDGTYSRKSLPPMEFQYQPLNWNKEIKTITRENIVNAPVGLTNNYQWTDLYGEGIPGILTEQAGGWFYKSNLGDINQNGDVNFTAAKKVFPKPSLAGISSGRLSIRDLEADGQKQVVVNSPGLQGYFQLTPHHNSNDWNRSNRWEPFRPFEKTANIDLQGPNLRMIDLNGDGQPELVVSEDNVFVWYPSDGKNGHKAAEFAAKTFDENKGPAVVFSDPQQSPQQSIVLADMSGDGLTDIVRIRNGEICYWANTGYGRFSAKVNMANAPLFDHPGSFNPKYLHLADVSGTGATDIVYLGKNRFKAYINLSGNSWSEAHEIEPFFPIDANCQLSVIDLLGTGTSCITWSSDLPAFSRAPMRYIDLMDGKKPHVLIHYKNNFGKETTLEYKSSTHFYLRDKRAGRPWITKLPFPVQVVSKIIVEEKITRVRFTDEYRYHHGYYDHPEREFRGFGLVEQLDTEHYEAWNADNAGNQLEKSRELYQKPVLTKTWFHTGAFLHKERILTQFLEEYWVEEYNRAFPDAPLPPLNITEPALEDARVTASGNILDTAIIDNMDADRWREAFRACKGMVLRQEVFALDAPPEGADDGEIKKQMKPYTAATHNCNIRLLQPRAGNPYMVFHVTESEALTIHYERDETDPRIAHTLNTKIDELGNILETASVVYPRKHEDETLPQKTKERQKETLITYTRNTFTNDVIEPGAYRLRLPAETETFELNHFPKSGDLYQLPDFDCVFDAGTHSIPYHLNLAVGPDPFPGAPKRRLIEHIRNIYYNDNLTAPLPLYSLQSLGLPHESYQLAYTPPLLQHIFGPNLPDPGDAMARGKFVHSQGDNNWWIRSGVVQYIDKAAAENAGAARSRFYSPISYTDPFGSQTTVAYYKDFFLFLQETRDALQNTVKVEKFDFRTLAPRQMRDINHNLSEILTDELGLVKAVALQGKDLDNDGEPELESADDLTGLEEITQNEAAQIQSFFQTQDSVALHQTAGNLLQHATSRFVYDFDAYRNHGKPVVAASINRETHHAHLGAGEQTKLQVAFQYSDGLGNVAMTKAQAEPGLAKKVSIQNGGAYTVSLVDTSLMNPKRLRWTGTGRTVLNNKGNPVKQYEPYFSVTPFYEDHKELVESGVTPIFYYDAPGRLIKTQHPDHTFSHVQFDAWKQAAYDQNDTVKENQWYNHRINNLIDAQLTDSGKDPAKEKEAALQAGKHHDTPSQIHLDTLGRPILSIDHNRDAAQNDEFFNTIIQSDIEGNARKVIDARGNTVMEYKYDMLGHRVYQKSMDAGERWILNNVMGNPVNRWDQRGHIFSYNYDPLQRPTQMKVWGGNGEFPLDNIYQKIVYGEGQPDDRQKNLRGQVAQFYDTAGKLQSLRYDLKGNLLEGTRQLAKDYKNVVDWSGDNLGQLDQLDQLNQKLEAEIFLTQTRYDALNRVIWSSTPDQSITEPAYNEANLLETVAVTQTGEAKTFFVKNIDYDEKGQQRSICYGNNINTLYQYDEETFRLLHLETKRGDGKLLQDLYYTYDPVGNITQIEDKSIPHVFFDNLHIQPRSRYVYDPLYRLIEARGREHAGQNNPGPEDNWDDSPFRKSYSPGDPMQWREYTQKYRYDSVGNIEQMRHEANGGGWTRDYEYQAINNRLNNTKIGGDIFIYAHHPRHGFMTRMPHLQVMEWNFQDELQAVSRQSVTNGGTPETTYYTYDAEGQRVRKVTENQAGAGTEPTKKSERFYLGGIEIYREHSRTNKDLERTTLHVMDDAQRIAMIETRNEDVNDGSPVKLVRYQLSNHLGTACLETDDDEINPRIISYEEYHPYGTTSYQAKNKDIKAASKRYRFTGKERDDESGFYYHGARYYACWLGRWTSADPAGLVDGVNLYMNVRGNPLLLSDPSGTSAFDRMRRAKQQHERRQAAQAVMTGDSPTGLDAIGPVLGPLVELTAPDMPAPTFTPAPAPGRAKPAPPPPPSSPPPSHPPQKKNLKPKSKPKKKKSRPIPEGWHVTTRVDEKTGVTHVHFTIKEKVVLIGPEGRLSLPQKLRERLRGHLEAKKKAMEEMLTTTDNTGKTRYSATYEYEFAEKNQMNEKAIYMEIGFESYRISGSTLKLGNSQKNTMNVSIIDFEGEEIDEDEFAYTGMHESFHTAGLDHPWREKDLRHYFLLPEQVTSNIMNSPGNPNEALQEEPGPNIIVPQIEKIRKLVEEQQPK